MNDINELIDHCNGIHGAIENRQKSIARRAAEGKTSPNAEAQLAALLALPYDYQTPKQVRSHQGWVASGGFEVG